MKDQVLKYKAFSYSRATIWLFIGPFLVLTAYFRDLAYFWATIYKNHSEKSGPDEFKKVINGRFLSIF